MITAKKEIIDYALISANYKLKVWMTIMENGWNVWVWLVDVASRRWV